MPHKIVITENGGIVSIYSGDVTDADFLAAYAKIIQLGIDISAVRYSITDFTEVDKYLISSECIRRQARDSLAVAKINPHIKVLVIAPREIQYGTSRMWQAYANEAGWEVKIFLSRSEAKQWMDQNLCS